jgi:lipoyl-dependent peroxiredoxin
MKVLYETEATSVGDGRAGEAMTHDGRLHVDLCRPPEMGGDDQAPGTNPEQLFAAGYSACFHSALRTIARREKQDVEDSAVSARVALMADDEGKYSLAVELVIELPGVEPDVAERMVEQAHGGCPYSRAIRGNVEVRRTVKA